MASHHPANLEELVRSVLPALEFQDFTPGELRKLIMDVYFTTRRVKEALTGLEGSGELSRAGRYRFQLPPATATRSIPVTDSVVDPILVAEANGPSAADPAAAPRMAPAPQAAPAAVSRLSTLGGYIMEVVCTAPGAAFPNSVVTQEINSSNGTNYNNAIVLFTAKNELAPKEMAVVVDPAFPEPTITGIRCV